MIKEFHAEDLGALLELRKAIEENINPSFFNWPEEIFRQEIQKSQVWLAQDPQTANLGAFVFFREEWDRFEIMVLGTSPLSQKKGLMTDILLKLQELAAQQGKGLGLEVHEKNETARRLYLKLGFKFLHCRKGYYKDGAAAELYIWKNHS